MNTKTSTPKNIQVVIAAPDENGEMQIYKFGSQNGDTKFHAANFIRDVFTEYGTDISIALEVDNVPVNWDFVQGELIIGTPLDQSDEPEVQ
jgi:hypothetical protein